MSILLFDAQASPLSTSSRIGKLRKINRFQLIDPGGTPNVFYPYPSSSTEWSSSHPNITTPTAIWPMQDESTPAVDTVGSNDLITPQGPATLPSFAVPYQSRLGLYFDSTLDQVILPSASTFDPDGSTSFTILVRVYIPLSSGGSSNCIFSKRGGTGLPGFEVYSYTGGVLRVSVDGGPSGRRDFETTLDHRGGWFDIALVIDRTGDGVCRLETNLETAANAMTGVTSLSSTPGFSLGYSATTGRASVTGMVISYAALWEGTALTRLELDKIWGGTQLPLKLYVIMGQSNAVGRDVSTNLSGEYANLGAQNNGIRYASMGRCPSDDGVATSCSLVTSWGNLRVGVDPTEADFMGSEMAFGRDMAAANPGPIGIIKAATSGTDLIEDWEVSPTTGNYMYPRAIAYIDNLLSQLPPGSVIAGMVWNQGESDATNSANGDPTYEANFTALLLALRTKYDATLPVVAIRLNDAQKLTNGGSFQDARIQNVQDAVDAVDAADVYLSVVVTEGIPLMAGNIHYSANGLSEIGVDAATAMLALENLSIRARLFSDFSAPQEDYDLSSKYATDEWLLQEDSVAYASNISGGSALGTFTSGYMGQPAIGFFDGTNLVSRKAWESSASTSRVTCADASALDSDDNDLCVKVVFRVKEMSGAVGYICSKRQLSGIIGWAIYINGDDAFVVMTGPGGSKTTPALSISVRDGSWKSVSFWYDYSADTLYAKSGSTSVSVSTSGMGSATTTSLVALGKYDGGSTEPGLQINYLGGRVNAPFAEAMYMEETNTPGAGTAVIPTPLRTSSLSVGVSANHVYHYPANTVARGYHTSLTSATQLGLYCNRPKTNYVSYSEDLTNGAWSIGGGASRTANAATAPDGFRSATNMSKVSGTQYSSLWATTASLTAGTVHTFSVWCRRNTGSGPVMEVRNGADTAEYAYRQFSLTEVGEFVRLSLPFVTDATADATYLIRLRPSPGAAAETASADFWGVQVEQNQHMSAYTPGAYVRTDGATETSTRSDYNASSLTMSSLLGEVEVSSIFLSNNDYRLFYPTSSGVTDNLLQGYNQLVDDEMRPGPIWKDTSNSNEEIYYHDNHIEPTELSNFRVLYDFDSGVDGFETVTYLDGIRQDGTATPFEGTVDPITSDTFFLGNDGTDSFQMEGIIDSVSLYKLPGELPADTSPPADSVVGVDFWTTDSTIDFSVNDVGDLSLWSVENYGPVSGWTRAPGNAVRNDPYYEMTTLSGVGSGAEISSNNTYLRGSFRCSAKTASEYGTVLGFFFYASDTEEIDMEILSRENEESILHCVVHENDGDTHKFVPLGFDPSAAFHEYRIDSYVDKIEFFVDGRKRTEILENVPTISGSIVVNQWSTAVPGWADGFPTTDAVLQLEYLTILHD